MTYVVGINDKRLGIAAIFCDTKCTEWDRVEHREAPALKSGELFTNCIFGAAGEVNSIIRFITDCKTRFSKISCGNQAWAEFEKGIVDYDFNGYSQFELILSSNASGVPILYLLDPQNETRLSKIESQNTPTTFVSIGTGKTLLDEPLKHYLSESSKFCLGEMKFDDHPYNWCAWLMRQARGHNALTLERIGVGGFFHFWMQSGKISRSQKQLFMFCWTFKRNCIIPIVIELVT